MKSETPSDQPSEEYRRFESLAKALIAVPKVEVDRAMANDKKKKARTKKARRPSTASP